jgi:hypothetical protein
MKISTRLIPRCALVLATLLCVAAGQVSGHGVRLGQLKSEGAEKPNDDSAETAVPQAAEEPDVTIEPSAELEAATKDTAWLGVSATEATETLASQLDLEPGVGLVVTYVAPDSPAAKSGLRKNDVLTQFDDQSLVHPAQLRKLVRVRQAGAVVKLGIYRGGKHQTVSVTLGKTSREPGLWENEEHKLEGNLKDLQKQFHDLHLDEAVRDQMRVLRESLGNIKIDQKEVQEDIRLGMEQARKALKEALHNMTNMDSALGPVRSVLESLAHSGVAVDDKADVVVRSSGKTTRSLVKSDDSGTIVLLSNPKLHLTAHDKDGGLLFDGPIESADEQAKVPRKLWQRVEPLVDQIRAPAQQPESKE